VRVAADLDFSTTKTQSQVVDPTKSVPTATSKSTETYTTPNGTAAGPVTTTPTTPAGGSSANNYSKTSQDETNEISKEITTRDIPAGTVIKTLNIAVAVDSGVKNVPPVAQLQSLLGTAVGFNQARGDRIVVTSTAFNTDAAATKKAGGPLALLTGSNTKTISSVVAAVMLLLITLLLSRSLRRIKIKEIDLTDAKKGRGKGEDGDDKKLSKKELKALKGKKSPDALGAGSDPKALPAGRSAPLALPSGGAAGKDVSAVDLLEAIEERPWLADTGETVGNR
jgi:flagellar biosynthesis/type III secretory pathway M-ring protein FliF/YscJ